MSHELDFSEKLVAEGNYKRAVKSLAKVEYKARLYEAEAEGMSELALVLRDKTSGSLRDECVRLHDVAQRYIAQHQAERAERQERAERHNPTVASEEVERAGSTVDGRVVVLVFVGGVAATAALAVVGKFWPCTSSGTDQGPYWAAFYLLGFAGALSFGLAVTFGVAWLGQSSRASVAFGCIGGVAAFLFSGLWLIVLWAGIAAEHCPG